MGGMSRNSGRWLRVLAIASAMALSAACLKGEAKTPAPRMAVPEPPPRLAIPVAVEPADPVATPAPSPTPATSTDKPATPPVTKPPVTTKPTSTTGDPATTGVPPPVPVLLPGGTEVEARAKERLDRAEKDLRRVNRASLGYDAREQYDSADRFIRMAKDAVTSRNFVFALTCADKAATLAALLLK